MFTPPDLSSNEYEEFDLVVKITVRLDLTTIGRITMSLRDLDPVYFGETSWNERLNTWLRERAPEYDEFYRANASHIAQSILEGEAALKMVVNIPADALLGFLKEGCYLNTYERKILMGEDLRFLNARRKRVDKELFGDDPDKYYFGAVALGGCGVRFYGEYCMVLPGVEMELDTQIMDRNSWDMEFEPLSNYDKAEVVSNLIGNWGAHATDIAKLKVLPQLLESVRLTTTGTVSDAILHDESFIEVHKRGSFTPQALYEVRESTAGPSIEAQLRYQCDHGQSLSPEEAIWITRRAYVNRALGAARVRIRIAETTGRTR